jgi:hypothetical protein
VFLGKRCRTVTGNVKGRGMDMEDDNFFEIGVVRFNGSDYIPARDNGRLKSQLDRVYSLMRDGQARTLRQIEKETGDPPASISAQIRHLRKERLGGHIVEKRYIGKGLFEYWIARHND